VNLNSLISFELIFHPLNNFPRSYTIKSQISLNSLQLTVVVEERGDY